MLTQKWSEDGGGTERSHTCNGASDRQSSSSGTQATGICDDWSEQQSTVGSSVDLFASDTPCGCFSRLKNYIVDPRCIIHKYIVLCLISLFITGPYFHDGMLACFKGPISDDMKLSNEQFGLLFAFSSLSGIICGPSGAFIVRYGRTRSAIIAGLACLMGSLFTVLGYVWDSLAVMLVARFVFWTALYTLMVVQNLLVYGLFEGPQLAVAYSFVLTACRLGAVFSYFFSGLLLHQFDVRGSLQISVVIVFVSFGATLWFAYLFRGTATAQRVRLSLPRGPSNAKKFSLALVRQVPTSVLATTWSLGLIYGIIFPFEVVADDMLQDEFGYSANNAGFLLTAIPAVAVFSPLFAPLLGSTIRGKSISCIVGFSLLAVAQLLLYTQYPWTPSVSFGLIGVAYSITCCGLWTLLPLVVSSAVPPENAKAIEGLATGLCYAAIAICQFCSNILVGMIKDLASYRWVCMYFFVCALCGALSALAASAWHRPLMPEAESSNSRPTPTVGQQGDEGAAVLCRPLNVEDSDPLGGNVCRSQSRSDRHLGG